MAENYSGMFFVVLLIIGLLSLIAGLVLALICLFLKDPKKSKNLLFIGGCFFILPVVICLVALFSSVTPAGIFQIIVIEVILLALLILGRFVFQGNRLSKITSLLSIIGGLIQMIFLLCYLALLAGLFMFVIPGEPKGGEYDYKEESGQIIVTNYKGNDTDVEIPATIAGKPVTGITSFGPYQEFTQRITIPDSVTSIHKYAFSSAGRLVIRCPQDSYAQKFAEEHDIEFVIDG